MINSLHNNNRTAVRYYECNHMQKIKNSGIENIIELIVGKLGDEYYQALMPMMAHLKMFHKLFNTLPSIKSALLEPKPLRMHSFPYNASCNWMIMNERFGLQVAEMALNDGSFPKCSTNYSILSLAPRVPFLSKNHSECTYLHPKLVAVDDDQW